MRNEAEQRRVDANTHVRGVRRPAEHREDVADTVRVRIRQVKAAPVLSIEVGEVVECGNYEVDRNEVDTSALDPDAWQPRRQKFAQFLDQFEEIVRTIDLVHFAGL